MAKVTHRLGEVRRIVILDTNALHGDVYLAGPGLATLFAASDENVLEGVEIWTPRGGGGARAAVSRAPKQDEEGAGGH